MPYAPETRRHDAHSGTSHIDKQQQLLNVFDFPGLYDLGPIVQRALKRPGSRGRSSHYSATALLGAVIASRATGARTRAVQDLRGTTWEQCRERYAAFTGSHDLAAIPPSRDNLYYFEETLAASPELREELHETFTRSSVGLARHLGNLTSGVIPDWSQPDERHTIYGDGTYVTPLSDVTRAIDPITDKVLFIGSRASTGRPRLADGLTDGTDDGKSHVRGINHIALHTWTRAGRIVLAAGQARSAESTTAIDLLDRLADVAGDGIHTLVYDRAITGWHLDYLMARYRIMTIGKAVGRASDSNDSALIADLYGLNRADQDTAAARLAAEHNLPYTPRIAPLLRPHVQRQLLDRKEPVPVGTSIYRTSSGQLDAVRSKYFWLTAGHAIDGRTCHHHLAVDDGALFTIDTDAEHGWAVKIAHVPCVSSTPWKQHDRWATRNTWLVPCPAGDFEWHTEWIPPARREAATPHGGDTHTHLPTAMRELRPLTRADGEKFHTVFDRRNDAESYNNWFKDSLGRTRRAASLSSARQDIDFLAAAILNNANTWYRAQHQQTVA